MKRTLTYLVLAGLLAALALPASALMTDAEASATVQTMLDDSKSSTEIIESLMEDGRSLEQATVLAVTVATGHARLNLARVGICLSVDVAQAEEVGRACVNVCSPETDEIIEGLIEGYVTGACNPPEYEVSSKANTGGVSPSI
jgi:hypothetical protein